MSELRAEIKRRDDAAREEAQRAAAEKWPCPECGAPPRSVEQNAVHEHRSMPPEYGAAGMYLPVESGLGMTVGFDVETTVTCERGHVSVSRETKMFENPFVGPPLL
jgi:hypothetical protein